MFILKSDAITASLARATALGRNPRPILQAMGNVFKSITEGNFNAAGAAYRPIPWVPKRDGAPSNLQLTRLLSRSFHLTITAQSAILGNPTPYARIHQFGGTIIPKNARSLFFQSGGRKFFAKKVTIPPRPFFPILNGQLTPAAKRLILAAGARAIARQASSS